MEYCVMERHASRYGIKEKEVTYKYSFNTDLSLRRTILDSQGSDRACYDSLTF